MQQDFTRMLDNTHKPDSKEIQSFIGHPLNAEWLELEKFIDSNYDFKPETIFYGKKYGWTVRFRKNKRTFCSLFPEKTSFTVLITLRKKESESVLSMKDTLNPRIWNIIQESKQLRDGRWLWIRILTKNDLIDVKKILTMKIKRWQRL